MLYSQGLRLYYVREEHHGWTRIFVYVSNILLLLWRLVPLTVRRETFGRKRGSRWRAARRSVEAPSKGIWAQLMKRPGHRSGSLFVSWIGYHGRSEALAEELGAEAV